MLSKVCDQSGNKLMNSRSESLAIIILHYGAPELTLRCVRSLYEVECKDINVIVVDNGTGDLDVLALPNRYSNLTSVELSENQGWAGGCNAGIRKAQALGAAVVCLLNNDTVVPNGMVALANLSRRFDEFGLCLLHPAVDYLDSDRTQLDPSGSKAVERPLCEGVYEIDYAYGACLLIPVQLFKTVGLFDERFFLQLEETDFYERATKAGYRTYCDTSVRVKHVESAAFGGRMPPLKLYYITRNTLLVIEKSGFQRRFSRRRLQTVYWLLRELHSNAPRRKLYSSFLLWLLLAPRYPQAFRRALFDYALRRFGRAPRSVEMM